MILFLSVTIREENEKFNTERSGGPGWLSVIRSSTKLILPVISIMVPCFLGPVCEETLRRREERRGPPARPNIFRKCHFNNSNQQ